MCYCEPKRSKAQTTEDLYSTLYRPFSGLFWAQDCYLFTLPFGSNIVWPDAKCPCRGKITALIQFEIGINLKLFPCHGMGIGLGDRKWDD